MEFISSDTNVWIDFATIDRLSLPFKLPYTYLMDEEVISNELIQPKGLGKSLTSLGLQTIELTEEEYFLAGTLNQKYHKLSIYDCVALAIAKHRGIVLLTGDGALRRAAIQNGVEVMGSIKIMDLLLEQSLISVPEYLYCMKEFKRLNGAKIRLPEEAIKERIKRYSMESVVPSDLTPTHSGHPIKNHHHADR